METADTTDLQTLLRFHTTINVDSWSSLDEYVDRMKDNQTEIFYILGENDQSIIYSPHLDIFKKHDLRTVDFWEDADGKNIIYYILEHDDMDARNRNFEAFRNDPDWIEAKESSERDGPIVERAENFFMKRVPYSPVAR